MAGSHSGRRTCDTQDEWKRGWPGTEHVSCTQDCQFEHWERLPGKPGALRLLTCPRGTALTEASTRLLSTNRGPWDTPWPVSNALEQTWPRTPQALTCNLRHLIHMAFKGMSPENSLKFLRSHPQAFIAFQQLLTGSR